ncbi:hypothetical protein [Salinivibrio sharmensis]|uniref:Uncharacterized protein n=1 Tax=Salinivibrio sharmensis TaxID=390883 RepID=A0ABX3KD02_9GAMM|nr:hypothetical protein [Salinivibrio sharmensis]OOE86794.1 hypothetical protein BZG74_11955 [Salinivibrio sharmensis]
MSWLLENKEWVFSGIGVSVLIFLLSLFRKNPSSTQIQKSGDNSTNYQSGGDINIGNKNDK